MRRPDRLAAALAVLSLALACSRRGEEAPRREEATRKEGPARSTGPPVVVRIAHGSEKKTWLEEQVKLFEASIAMWKPMAEAYAGAGKTRGFAVAVLDAPWVGPGEREGAQSFLAFLRARPAQERALALGFRPAAPAIPVGAPVDAAHGVDPKLPQTLLEVPPADVLEKLLDTWRALKEAADVVLVFDKSGSMAGEPLVQAVRGATRFVETLSDRDDLTLVFLLDARYQAFVTGIERGVTKFESSTGTFMVDMVRFGPSRYDIAVVYESLVIGQLENAQGRWGDHPAAIMSAPWVTPAQRAAARRFLSFLRSRPMQERALAFGFRPADPAVPVRTADARNPFTRLAPYGLRVDIPPAATPPDAAVVRNLLTMWARVVGTR